MQVVLPDIETRATFRILADRPMDDQEFFDFCAKNPGLRIEREPSGEITIMPPAGFETGYRNNEISRQLGNWAKADRRGVALDSNTEYVLPNGAARSPDASWVLRARLEQFTEGAEEAVSSAVPGFRRGTHLAHRSAAGGEIKNEGMDRQRD